MALETFTKLLDPFVQRLSDLSLDDPAAAKAWLEEHLSVESDAVRALKMAAFEGKDEGWLLPKQNGTIRFGRPAKDLHGFTVDAVWMADPGPRHRHPRGEIDLCFADDGDPRFDGNPEGWTVYGPDTTHVPTVSGGSMLILYFLPSGEIEFL